MDIGIKPPDDYFDFYRRLAVADIESDIVPVYYKNSQRDKLIKRCGDTDGKTVLEIGIGKDPLISYLHGCSCRVAADIAPEYLGRLSPDIIAWQGNAENLPYQGVFDLVVCSDVLEHVLNPDALLQSIRKSLKLYGKAIIKTPYKENLSQYIGNKWEGCHLRTFDHDSLEAILIKNGLMPTKFYFSGFDCATFVFTERMARFLPSRDDLIRTVNYGLSVTKTLDIAQRVLCRLPDWLPPLFGYKPIEITAVCEKK